MILYYFSILVGNCLKLDCVGLLLVMFLTPLEQSDVDARVTANFSSAPPSDDSPRTPSSKQAPDVPSLHGLCSTCSYALRYIAIKLNFLYQSIDCNRSLSVRFSIHSPKHLLISPQSVG
jgi:hypothetical protein